MAWLRARLRMVARLLAEGRIEDGRLLWAFLRVPRHLFVPPELAAASYGADAVELVDGQTLTCPDFVAQMVSLLALKPGQRVLEVGSGTGFQTAVLAACGVELTSIEVRPSLHRMAQDNLARARIRGVDLRLGDGAAGAPDRGPFDAILLSCAIEDVPPALLAQLAPGGRLVLPEGDPDRLQTLVLLERTEEGLQRTEVRAAWFVPMWRPDAAAG